MQQSLWAAVVGRVFQVRVVKKVVFLVPHRCLAADHHKAVAAFHAAHLVRGHQLTPRDLIAVAGRSVAALADALPLGADGLFAQQLGNVLKGAVIVAAKVNKAVAVADDRFPVVLVFAFDLGNILQNDIAAYVAAARNGKDLYKVFRRCDIGELVHHQAYMNRQCAVKFRRGIRKAKQLVKQLGVQNRNHKVKGIVIVRDNAEDGAFLHAQLRQEHFIGGNHLGKRRRLQHMQIGYRRDHNAGQGFRAAELERTVLQHSRVMRVALLQFTEQNIHTVFVVAVLTDLAFQNHIHHRVEVALIQRGFVQDIQNQRCQKHNSALVPELVFAAGGCRVLFGVEHQRIGKLHSVLIGFQVRYRIVMSAEMHKVNDRHGDAVFLHSTAEGIGQLPLGVQKEVGAAALQGIRLYKEAGLTAAGTANHNNVQIPLVPIGIIAEADILGKNDFLPRVLAVAVAFVQLFGIAPMGRAVFLAGAAVRLIEQIAIHPQRVQHQDRQQKFRGAAAPTQAQRVVQ